MAASSGVWIRPNPNFHGPQVMDQNWLVGNPFFLKKNVSLLKGVQYLLKHGSLTMYVVAQHGGETDHEF